MKTIYHFGSSLKRKRGWMPVELSRFASLVIAVPSSRHGDAFNCHGLSFNIVLMVLKILLGSLHISSPIPLLLF